MDIVRIDDNLLERAFQAVRKSRIHHWPSQLNKHHAGQYHLSSYQAYFIGGACISVWDAVVLNAVSYRLKVKSRASHCHDIKALHQVKYNYHKVFKSDIDSYYASIKHEILLQQLRDYTDCSKLMAIFEQYMKRLEIKEGQYHHFEQGILRGCSLSPLRAAIYLAPMDNQLQGLGFYRRYMDDWIVLVKTRSQLRKVIKITHQVLKSLKLRMHPKKTFIGCIKKGFAFLGIQWNKVPEIAKQSIENHQHNSLSLMRKMQQIIALETI